MTTASRLVIATVVIGTAVAACSTDPATTTVTTTTSTVTTTTAPSVSTSVTTSAAVPASTTEAATASDEGPWPTDGWITSTPEEQGMESGGLAALVEYLSTSPGIDSVTVVRNGHLVLDAVFYPFPADRAHIIHSCTKSIVGTLIGIAVDSGLLEGTSVPVVEILAEAAPEDIDDRKSAMTVEDLLTMSAGLDCRDSYIYRWLGLREMRRSDDWAAYMLALPMSEEPGTLFEYCNGGSYLLSAILTEVTGGPALDFARETLFEPLGITDVTWPSGPGGINFGWGEMYLHPRDMAKFGYLYLHRGEWDGRQIVPAAWVEAATSPKASARTLSDFYGYQWWVDDGGYFMALGYGGQYIIVDPAHDLVVVFTSGVSPRFDEPERLFRSHIVDSVVSDGSLPPDPEAEARLREAVANAARLPDLVDPALPPLADQIDGVTYVLDDNQGGFAWFRLDFSDGDFMMAMEDVDGPIEVTAAFDGRFHESEAWGRPWAFRHVWTGDETLTVEFQIIGGVGRGEFTFAFDGDAVQFRYLETVNTTDIRATGNRET